MRGSEVIKILEDYKANPVYLCIKVDTKTITINVEAIVSTYEEQFNKETFKPEAVYLVGEISI